MAFAAQGAAGVVFADLDLPKVQKVAEKSSKMATNPSYRTLPISVDVTDLTQVQDMVSQTLALFGKVDYNVNCAGVCYLPLMIGSRLNIVTEGVHEYCNFFGEYLNGGVGTGQSSECVWCFALHPVGR